MDSDLAPKKGSRIKGTKRPWTASHPGSLDLILAPRCRELGAGRQRVIRNESCLRAERPSHRVPVSPGPRRGLEPPN